MTTYYRCMFSPCIDVYLAAEKPTEVYTGHRKLIINPRLPSEFHYADPRRERKGAEDDSPN